MSSPAVTEPDQIRVGRHILKLFHRVGELERRLTELECGHRRKPANKASDQTARQLAARDKALARRKAERDAAEAGMMKLEPLPGGRAGVDSFALARRLLTGD